MLYKCQTRILYYIKTAFKEVDWALILEIGLPYLTYNSTKLNVLFIILSHSTLILTMELTVQKK